MTRQTLIIAMLLAASNLFGQNLSNKSDQELEKLKTEAVKNEDYNLAGQINDEIKKRESQVSNEERIAIAKTELEEAISNEEYGVASELKNEIELREKLEVEVKNENYAGAESIKNQLEEGATTASNSGTNTAKTNTQTSAVKMKEIVYDPNFDEAKYNETVNLKGHTPPKPGKAAVYFVRVTKQSRVVNFIILKEKEFIGNLKGGSYVRTEVDPGEYLFWAGAENQSFITMEAIAGHTYLIYVDVKMGWLSSRVELSAVLPNQEDRIRRCVEVINKRDPSVLSDAQLTAVANMLEERGYVKNKLNAYETDWKNSKDFDHIPADSFIPEAKLK